jgi:hypothetical protein
MNFANIPPEMKQRDTWVCYASPSQKAPLIAGLNASASSTNPLTWRPFALAEAAVKRGMYAGVGFALEGSGLVAIDLDDVCNPDSCHIAPWAAAVVRKLVSYTEFSPSGRGLHIISRGQLPANSKHRLQFLDGSKLEAWDSGRYITMTGELADEWPQLNAIRDCDFANFWQELEEDMQVYRPVAERDAPSAGELLRRWGIAVLTERSEAGMVIYEIECAGTHGEYPKDDGKAFVIQFADGGKSCGCQHASCSFSKETGNHWNELRAMHEPRVAFSPTKEQAYRQPTREPWGTGAQTRAVHHAESDEPHAALSATITEPAQRTPPNRGAPVAPTLHPAALYGLAGDTVAAILPASEANDATLLLHFLVAYGNLIGRCAYYLVESTRHYCNLFYAAVGDSSKGRKGTGWGRIRHVFTMLNPLLDATDGNWTTKCISSGLSSGEGLIAAVADRDGEKTDKRLLIMQTEFASVLRVMQRDGNTLSAVLRDAFDFGWLRTLTKHDPLHAENAHVSLITHITRDELKRSLCETETSNGFANRFLWARSCRSKYLPDGGEIDPQVMTELPRRLREAVDAGKIVQQMRRDERARDWWHAEYRRLSDGVPGLLGDVTNRGEVMVLRLSMIFALLDCTSVIGEPHLVAAKALWDYCFESAKYVFGAALGYPLADDIWNALQAAGDKGLSRTQIFNVLGNNQKKEKISNALMFLEERGLAHRRTVGEGRSSTEVWYVGPRSETV